jgi:hypothetical protein
MMPGRLVQQVASRLKLLPSFLCKFIRFIAPSACQSFMDAWSMAGPPRLFPTWKCSRQALPGQLPSIPPKEIAMSGHYEISSNDKGQFSFVLKAANGQVILRSQMYESRGSAQTGIASVQTNSPSDDRYELNVASDGRPYFNLRAGNGQVIGTSQMYSSDEARATGIASVKTNGPGTDVRDA